MLRGMAPDVVWTTTLGAKTKRFHSARGAGAEYAMRRPLPSFQSIAAVNMHSLGWNDDTVNTTFYVRLQFRYVSLKPGTHYVYTGRKYEDSFFLVTLCVHIHIA